MTTAPYLIHADGSSLGLRLNPSGPAEIVYWGKSVPRGDSLRTLHWRRVVPHGQLDGGEALSLFPTRGAGFTGAGALEAHRNGRAVIAQLRPKDRLCHAHGLTEFLEDKEAALELELELLMDPATGVVAARSVLTNSGADVLEVQNCSAPVFPLIGDELLVFGGRWTQEMATQAVNLRHGGFFQENRSGRTSHHAPGFIVNGASRIAETGGKVLACHIAWSGDHRIVAEQLRDGRGQLQLGEALGAGEIRLGPGEAYRSPTVYAVCADGGLGAASEKLHRFVRGQILDPRTKDAPRKVHFNTWEAVYFDHNVRDLLDLIDAAAVVGCERFVLDDGWFSGRTSDKAGLGDWFVDACRYPDGLAPLIERAKARGIGFGLWVEPEMANADSDLLRAHPDWILGAAGREQPLGRGQWVLDLTRAEVFDHVLERLVWLLSNYEIEYIKWDMNRDLTHAVSQGAWAVSAQTRAVYRLMDRLRAAFPKLEIESCASGGARADYEVLKRADRIWASDCNDPVERLKIQRSLSMFFPPEVIGAHVGPKSSHTTARTTSISLRAAVAMLGHFGVEGDIRKFSQEDREILSSWIDLYKSHRSLLHNSRFFRLDHPDPGLVAFQFVGDGSLIFAFQVDTPVKAAPGR